MHDFRRVAALLGLHVSYHADGTWDVGGFAKGQTRELRLPGRAPVEPMRRYWYIQTAYGPVKALPMGGSVLVISIRRRRG